MSYKEMYKILKRVLPPRVSFRLRSLKSSYIDSELIELRLFLKKFGTANGSAIDIGANYGIYAGVLSGYFNNVIAVEPNPNCAEYLRRVLPPNCVVIEAAVSDRIGRTALRVPVIAGAVETTRATISLMNEFEGLSVTDTMSIDVEMQSIDSMSSGGLFGLGQVSFLKIDVEGHEYSVLQGGKQLLASHQPALCIEVEQRHGAHVDTTNSFLNDIGYYRVRRSAEKYIIHDSSQNDHSVDSESTGVNLYYVTARHLKNLGIDRV